MTRDNQTASRKRRPKIRWLVGTVGVVAFLVIGMMMSVLMTPMMDIRDRIPNELDRLLSRLPTGQIAHQIPRKVALNEQATARLTLSPKSTREELQAQFDESAPIQFAEVKIGQRMRAALRGTEGHFEIMAVGSEEQAVSYQTDTEWQWTITPKKPGTEHVILTLDLLVKIEGEDSYRTIETYRDSVEITATIGQRVTMFWNAYWQFIIGTLLLPLLGFIYARNRKRLEKQKEEKEAEAKRRKQIGFHAANDDETKA
jgi:hypothetical protein